MPWNSGFGLLYQRDDDPIQAAGDIGSTMFHPVGTCKMGDDERAMLESRLRVRQLGGLRVVDASIMPTITGTRTRRPSLSPKKAADMLCADKEPTVSRTARAPDEERSTHQRDRRLLQSP